MKVPLPASSLSGACGLNPYCSPQETAENVVKKYFPEIDVSLNETEEALISLKPSIHAALSETIEAASSVQSIAECDSLEKKC